jgi:hypothetical protein
MWRFRSAFNQREGAGIGAQPKKKTARSSKAALSALVLMVVFAGSIQVWLSGHQSEVRGGLATSPGDRWAEHEGGAPTGIGFVFCARGPALAHKMVVASAVLRRVHSLLPISAFVDRDARRIFQDAQEKGVYNIVQLSDRIVALELPFVTTALDFAEAALRRSPYGSVIWLNSAALPSYGVAHLIAKAELTMRQKSLLLNGVSVIVPEAALNWAYATWDHMPAVAVISQGDSKGLALSRVSDHLVDVVMAHGARTVLPLIHPMHALREAILRGQIEMDDAEAAGFSTAKGISLAGTRLDRAPQKNETRDFLIGDSRDAQLLAAAGAGQDTCERLQTLGRTVAWNRHGQTSRHTVEDTNLQVRVDALAFNRSLLPSLQCGRQGRARGTSACFSAGHVWEAKWRRWGKLAPLSLNDAAAVAAIYAPPPAGSPGPSIALITVLGAGENWKRRDSRGYMVRIKQLFAQLSQGSITFELYLANELLCGDDAKTWKEVELLSHGTGGPAGPFASGRPGETAEAQARLQACARAGRAGLSGEFGKILAVSRALEKNARAGGAEWVLLVDSDVWLHPSLMRTGALARILASVPASASLVATNYRFLNTGLLAFRARGVRKGAAAGVLGGSLNGGGDRGQRGGGGALSGAGGAAARALVRDWWAVASAPGFIECHAFDQAALQALVLLRAANWTTAAPGGFACSAASSCGGNVNPFFKTCDQAFQRGCDKLGFGGLHRGFNNTHPLLSDMIYVLRESDSWPRPMCLFCESLHDVPEEHANFKVRGEPFV